MAYRTRYTFSFDSPEGKEVEIIIAENGYTGSAINRPLGGAPIFRMDNNGSINGTSLEIPAECQVEDEFADLYTSDPTKFMVTLSINGTDSWFGFITPEIYAAPWVDPPYDVALTATDGLGELKRYEYEERGLKTLANHLTYLLAKTGLSLSTHFISKLTHGQTTYDYFLTDTKVDLDYMAGQTCYDVLQAILDSIHATIRQRGGSWLIIRETDVTDCIEQGAHTDVVEAADGTTTPIVPFGSMRTEPVWPVGRLTSEIVPARKSTVINSTMEQSGNLLPDGDMVSGTWSGDGTYDSTNKQYQLPSGKYIYRNAALPQMITGSTNPDLTLSVSARQSDAAAAHNVKIRVKAYGQRVNLTTMATYYLADDSISSPGEPYWSDTEKYISKELKAASYGNDNDLETVKVSIPFARLSSYFINPISYLEIRIESDDSTVYVDSAELVSLVPYTGVKTQVSLNNGARGADNEVDITFADTYAYNEGLSWMMNALWYPHSGTDYLIQNFSSGRIASCRLGQFLGQDYALSIALPRLSMKGILHLPSDIMPPVFLENDGLTFMVQTYSYDLLQDEMDMSAVSLPAATISVQSITQEREYGNTGGSSSGGSGGSGGGGGGVTTLGGLSDVDLITVPPADGNSLIYNGTSQMWVPGSPSGGAKNVFYGTCPTAQATGTKVVTASGFSSTDLAEGTVLHVLFSNTNTASPMYLNVNSTGAVQVVHNQTVQYMWSNNTIASFVYENSKWRLFGNFAYTNRYGKVMLSTTIAQLLANNDKQSGYAITPNLGWQLFLKSLRAPEVKIIRGHDNSSSHDAVQMFKFFHPLSESSQISAEVVLMMYAKKRRTKVHTGGSGQQPPNSLYKNKEKWGVARGRLATNEPLTAHYIGVDRAWYLTLDEVRIHIIQHYVKSSGSPITPPGVLDQFRRGSPWFGSGSQQKKSRLFGFALRFQNPEFVATSGINESTGSDLNGNPRWIYSEVFPVMVWINEWMKQPDDVSMNVMGFQLNPYKRR